MLLDLHLDEREMICEKVKKGRSDGRGARGCVAKHVVPESTVLKRRIETASFKTPSPNRTALSLG